MHKYHCCNGLGFLTSLGKLAQVGIRLPELGEALHSILSGPIPFPQIEHSYIRCHHVSKKIKT